MNARIGFLVCLLAVVPSLGFGAVYYFTGNGASNDRGYLISDPANWGLSEITESTQILGLQNVGTKKCVLSLNADLKIARWSVEDSNNKDLAFDLGPYTFEGTGICIGPNRTGTQLELKSGTLKCATFNVPNKDTSRDNLFYAHGADSALLVKTLNFVKCTNNTFVVADGATLANYQTTAQELKLFNSSVRSYRNVFCVSNATVRNYATVTLGGGLENTVRFENVTFQDKNGNVSIPCIIFSDGVSNCLEIADQRMEYTGVNGTSPFGMASTSYGRIVMSKKSELVVTNNSYIGFFGSDTVCCSLEITDGSSLMHTNWNAQVQVGADRTTAISNTVRVAGVGSKLGYNGAIIIAKHSSPYSGLLIEDGATVSRVISAGGGGGVTYISQGSSHHNWVCVTGKGSKFSPSAVTIACGDSTNSQGIAYGNCNSFVVTDEAIAQLGPLQMGYFNIAKDLSLETRACSNRVEVLNGASYAGTYINYAGHDNFLVVSNATMALSQDLNMPWADLFAADYARDMHVVLGGTNTQITATGKMTFDRNTDFSLSVPSVGMTLPVLKAKGDITFANCGALKVDWPASRKADVVLAQTEGALSVDNASLTVMRASLPPRLQLKVVGKRLVLGVKPGMVLILR